jgi:hypothetical protein
MACDYSNLCGPESNLTSDGNNVYVKNGESAYQAFSFENNHVYMPYVELIIGDSVYISGDAQTSSMTVPSFECLPEDKTLSIATSTSYIQSFEMTVGKSFDGNIVIITCDYEEVKKLLNVTPPESCEWDKYTLGATVVGHINIGWIIKGCNGITKKYTVKECCSNNYYANEDDEEVTSGPYIYGVFKKVDVVAENGVYKVTMSFVDGFSFNEESKLDAIFGSEIMRKTFEDAMKLAANFNCKNRTNTNTQQANRIRFGSILNATGGITVPTPWKFKPNDGGKAGVLSVWNTNRESLFDFLREISLFFETVNKKGWWFAYDNGSCGFPNIWLVEDRNNNICAGENLLQVTGPIITYIVNGGDCSPVIKFNPSFNSVPLQNDKKAGEIGKNNLGLGAVSPSAVSSKSAQLSECYTDANGKIAEKPANNNNSATGMLASVSLASEVLNFFSPSLIPINLVDTIYSHAKTEAGDGNAMALFAPIKATLEIHGDPFWANSFNVFKNCFIRIIFINTYCIINKGNGEGCEFLQGPKCNDRFSGVYKVGSARHSINAGSYVTSLELFSITSGGGGGGGGNEIGMPM